MRLPHVFCILAIDFRDTVNLPKTVERTSENKNGFLAKDAAIVLTVSARFSATCCCKYVSEKLFSGTRFPVKKNYPNVPRCKEMEQNESHFLIYNRSYRGMLR